LEKLSVKRKLFAALVMTAGLATLISALGVPLAGRQSAQRNPSCASDDFEGAMLPLELGQPPTIGTSPHADCYLDALHDMLGADNLFLISYSSLNFFLFLLLVGSGGLRPATLWCLAGTILSVVMLAGDFWENQALYQWIKEARHALGGPAFSMPPPSYLALATNSKWIALAVASLLGGVAFLFQRFRLLKLLILPGAVGAVLIGMGVYHQDSDRILSGMNWLIALWTGGLLYAVLVALEQASPISRLSVEKKGAVHV
jgi:hypothetical protein